MISLAFGSSGRLQGWLNHLWRSPPLLKSSGASTLRLVRISAWVRKSHRFCSCANLVQAAQTCLHVNDGNSQLKQACKTQISLPKMLRWTRNNTSGKGICVDCLNEFCAWPTTLLHCFYYTHWALVIEIVLLQQMQATRHALRRKVYLCSNIWNCREDLYTAQMILKGSLQT